MMGIGDCAGIGPDNNYWPGRDPDDVTHSGAHGVKTEE